MPEHYDLIIGRNIESMRRSQQLTQQQLADEVSKLGSDVTARMVGCWQRGQRSISAQHLHDLSVVFGCTMDFLSGDQSRQIPWQDRLLEQIKTLSEQEQEILLYAAILWKGDHHALIQFCGLYMALQKHDRQQVAGYGLWMYDNAVKRNALQECAPDIDIQYLHRKWRGLNPSAKDLI